jgi:hypothetical protein
MRLELPVRIPLTKTLLFASALFCVQQFQHTSLVFSVLFFAFVVLGNMAFNVGGGFSRASGAYVFLFAMLTTVIGVVWKSVLGEPADSNLLVPQLDLACYTASMAMLLLVILLNKVITGSSQGIARGEVDYTLAALGCLIPAILETILNALGAGGSGSVLSALNQLSQFFPLATILGTIGAIKDSGGRRSVNAVSAFALGLDFLLGTLAFSKQGMLTPMVCWLIGAAFMRFKLRVIHFIVIPLCAVFAFSVAPLMATGRIYVGEGASYAARAVIAFNILAHLREARQDQIDSNNALIETQGHVGYYNTPQGFLERLSILSVDDTFFNYTDRGNYIGYHAVLENYENFIPHFLLPDKPVPVSGNFYAHQIGGYLADADDSTGISFSPVAEAYHIGGWPGILILLPAVWLSLFVSVDYICGDLRRSPWGLLVVLIFSHSAAESLLGGLIWISGYGSLGIVLAILFTTEIAPVLGALFYGGNRKTQSVAAGLLPVRPHVSARSGGSRAVL